jgi:hypothetical protein
VGMCLTGKASSICAFLVSCRALHIDGEDERLNVVDYRESS